MALHLPYPFAARLGLNAVATWTRPYTARSSVDAVGCRRASVLATRRNSARCAAGGAVHRRPAMLQTDGPSSAARNRWRTNAQSRGGRTCGGPCGAMRATANSASCRNRSRNPSSSTDCRTAQTARRPQPRTTGGCSRQPTTTFTSRSFVLPPSRPGSATSNRCGCRSGRISARCAPPTTSTPPMPRIKRCWRHCGGAGAAAALRRGIEDAAITVNGLAR